MTYGTVDDLQEGYQTLTVEERLVAGTLLGRAERLILAQVPSVPTRVAAGTLDVQLVADVEVAIVERVMRNPDGRRSESKTGDDYTHSWTLDNAVSTGGLYLTADERELLAPSVPRLSVGTIRLGYAL